MPTAPQSSLGDFQPVGPPDKVDQGLEDTPLYTAGSLYCLRAVHNKAAVGAGVLLEVFRLGCNQHATHSRALPSARNYAVPHFQELDWNYTLLVAVFLEDS
jgi:hypothetical protein